MDRKSVWIIGDWQHPDFGDAVTYLQSQAFCTSFAGTAAACHALGRETDYAPDIVVLMQSRPGQISQEDIERLHAAAPLAHLIGLIGPWCEGELRSGRPWRGVVRIPWEAWSIRLPHELGLNDVMPCHPARLPKTATDIERLQRSLADMQRAKRQGIAAICTASGVAFESLHGALQVLGVSVLCRTALEELQPDRFDLVLIDGWARVAAASSMIDRIARLPVPPRILLLPFPRPEDVSRATELGIAGVLAQPLLLADLSAIIARCMPLATATEHETAA